MMIRKELITVTHAGLLVFSICGTSDFLKETHAFSVVPKSLLSFLLSGTSSQPSLSTTCSLKMADQPPKDDGPAGSFFHSIPPSDDSSSSSNAKDDTKDEIIDKDTTTPDFDAAISKLIRQRKKPPRASRPSTIDGVPTERATGFGKPKEKESKKSTKPYIAIGPPDNKIPINDPSKPERDDQGYTLYTDTSTGEKSRVFEALVDYPSVFTMKIVGANEGLFVQEMVALVAENCNSDVDQVKHSTKINGKWVSVTVHAPVQSAEMLYALYEKIDLDPRVKFKF